MKAVFGVLSLLIVLAVVAVIAKKQVLRPVADGGTVAQQARAIEDQARASTAQALQQGAQRNERADP